MCLPLSWVLRVGHFRVLQISAKRERNLEMLGFTWKLDFEDLSKQMWRFRGGIRSRGKLPRYFPVHRQRLRGEGSSEVGALSKGSGLNWVGFLCHLSPFSAEVDADFQLCCLLCSLLTLELCAWEAGTWGTFWWVPLSLLSHSFFMSLQQSFFWLHSCETQVQECAEKILCRHWCGCSSCRVMDWWQLGREGLSISVSQKVLYIGTESAESPLPARKCGFEIYPYKSFWQLFLLGTQSVQHCEFSQVFPWHAINVLSDEMS